MSNKNQDYILIVGGEFPLRERILAGALRAGKGVPVLTLAKARSVAAIKFFDGYIVADYSIPENVLEAVKKHEAETGAKPLVVIPMNDFTVRTAVLVSEHYGLNHNSTETVHQCRDKFVMKQVLSAAGLPVPRFGAFSTYQELLSQIDYIGFPLVIKPRELAGSVGVIKVSSQDQLEDAFNRCVADVKALNVGHMTPDDRFVVEEYIAMQNELSVEVFNHGDVHSVIAVTDKYLGPEPYFVEVGHTVPSIHTGHLDLISIAERACACLNIRYGIAHFEARIKPNGEVCIIEVGARTGGDTIMDLVERAYGINPYELHVASYLDVPVQLPGLKAPLGLSGVAFLKAREGVVDQVRIPGILPEVVVNMQVTAKPKDVSEAPLSWRAREGSVEFFWKDRAAEKGFSKHLEIARDLTESIFVMQ
jgi:biotin carboxylase